MIDFIGGLCTGVAITLVGHPMDTIKVRMQAGEVISLGGCVRKTFRADGLQGFFSGISSPLWSVPVINALVFTAYAQSNSWLTIDSYFWKGVISGSYAGLINTIVVTPVELIKIKMQVQSNDLTLGQSIRYRSTWDCVRKTVAEDGINGLFKGGVITLYREVPGYGVQFASFEGLKELFRWMTGREELAMGYVFTAGMIAGLNCWAWSYPQDVIKTKIQSGCYVVKGWDGGVNFLIKDIWVREGWIGFWRGFSACTLRATLPNGFGFLVNEMVQDYLICLKGV